MYPVGKRNKTNLFEKYFPSLLSEKVIFIFLILTVKRQLLMFRLENEQNGFTSEHNVV